VTTILDVPPGAGDLCVALAHPVTGATMARRGAWGIGRAAPTALPRPRSEAHYLPFGGKMALIGVRAGDAWQSGTQERVALRFLGLRPIVGDYVVSVGLHGPGVAMPPSDWVPALGAMPTFKWVRGSRVTDVHLMDVPAGAQGEAELALGVYEAFTARALPPLDERIARLGRPTVPLRTVSVH
jgi:hypothetical protein